MGVKKRKEPKGVKAKKKKKRVAKVPDSEDPAFVKARLLQVAKNQKKLKKREKLIEDPPTKSNLLNLIHTFLRDSGFPAAAKQLGVELEGLDDKSDLNHTVKAPEPYTLGYIFLKWHRRERKLEQRRQSVSKGDIKAAVKAQKKRLKAGLPALDFNVNNVKITLANSNCSSDSSSDSEDISGKVEPQIVNSALTSTKRKASDDLVDNFPKGKKKQKAHADARVEGTLISNGLNGKTNNKNAVDNKASNSNALSEAISVPLPKSTSGSEDSESDFAKRKRLKKEKKEKKKIGKSTKESSKSSKTPVIETNGTSSSTKPDPQPIANGDITPQNGGDSSSSAAVNSESMNSDRQDMINKLAKKRNTPFSRIPAGTKVDPRLASNEYVPYDYAEQAHRDLIVTKGKGFTKEKNKKKRGSYRGGAIDVNSKNGIRFD